MEIPRRLLLVAALAVLLTCAACGGTSGANGNAGGAANASCVAPYLNDQPPSGPFHARVPTVSPGSVITIYGHWYTSTCNDTGGDEPLKPLPPVHLTLTLPGGEVEDVGELSAGGPDLGFSTEAHVPPTTPEGIATVRDDQEHPATYTFKVGQQTRFGTR